MRRFTILVALVLAGCSLYGGTSSSISGSPLPDAGTYDPDAAHCCDGGCGYPPDAGIEDGGQYLPDAAYLPDGGGYLPDAFVIADGGSYLPPDAH